jgi:hypothetical protein
MDPSPVGSTVPNCQAGARVDRLRTPPLVVFALVSAVAHAGLFVGALRRRHEPPALAFQPGAETLAGDSVDVEPAAQEEEAAPETSEPSAEGPRVTTAIPTRSPPPLHPSSRATGGDRSAPPGAAAPPAPAVYGAVGVRYATDLATTFTRAFPQAASADGVWGSVPLGSAGTADLLLTLDEGGHLTASHVGGTPSPALRRGIERTLSLLAPRTFVARGATTHLRVTARVAHDDVHDGLHGEVFALSGGSFTGDVGTAFFALPSAGGGRRIDVELRLLP